MGTNTKTAMAADRLSRIEAASPTKQRPPYLVYALLVGGMLLARAVDLATQSMPWTDAVYNSASWNRMHLTLAIVASTAGAFYLKRHLRPAIAWLACGMIGGVSMMLVNSIPGAIIGLVIGGVVIGAAPSASVTKFLSRTIGPAILAGFVAGGGSDL